MDDIRIVIWVGVAGVVLPYLLPFIFWMVLKVERSKLSNIKTISQFTDNIRLWKGKIRLRKNIESESIERDTIETVITHERGRLSRLKKLMAFAFVVPFVDINIALGKHIVNYYIKATVNYEIPAGVPKLEIITLITLSVWISVYLLLQVLFARTDMYVDKLNQFK